MSSEAREEETDTIQPGTADPGAPLYLVVDADGVHTTHPLPDVGELSLGRSRDCTVRIDHPSVSRTHAFLSVAGGKLHVRDAGSANGTRLRGVELSQRWAPAVVGDLIEVGTAIAVVRRASSVLQLRRVWSHGYFEGRVEEECARSTRAGRTFAVLRLNVGGKPRPGQLEELFAQSLRAPDVLAVYAPDEFEVLLVEATPAQAEAVSARLVTRLQVAGLVASVGLACFPRDASAPGDLLAMANAAVRGLAVAGGDDGMLGVEASAPMRKLRAMIEQVAPGHISVLILGETGVGKEVCAESVHRLSPRAARTFLKLNCAALSESLLESELFGHERGAFTGAHAVKLGLIETADGGTMFLDEVGELPMSIQVKLLRVLDEKKVLRVGALTPRAVDVRIVAATNRDLEAEVVAGRFRQDLYFRLAGVTLSIPPLRERVGEILALAQGFVARAAQDGGLPVPPDVSPQARAVLERYAWPGNVRELRNVMERAVLLCNRGPILPHHLPVEKMEATLRPSSLSGAAQASAAPRTEWDDVGVTHQMVRLPAVEGAVPADVASAASAPASAASAPPAPSAPASAASAPPAPPAPAPPPAPASAAALKDELLALEKQRILEALAQCAGNQSAAARLLGISRGTLIARLEEFGVARPRKPR